MLTAYESECFILYILSVHQKLAFSLRILAGTLVDDRKKYGADNSYHIPEEGGAFELSVEENM